MGLPEVKPNPTLLCINNASIINFSKVLPAYVTEFGSWHGDVAMLVHKHQPDLLVIICYSLNDLDLIVQLRGRVPQQPIVVVDRNELNSMSYCEREYRLKAIQLNADEVAWEQAVAAAFQLVA